MGWTPNWDHAEDGGCTRSALFGEDLGRKGVQQLPIAFHREVWPGCANCCAFYY